jgi:hypothetical protein
MFCNIFLKTKLVLAIVPLVLLGCGSSTPNGRERQVHLDQVYQPTGVHRYLLADIPSWAHRSSAVGCFKSPIRYVDFSALRDSFQLSYADATQFQLLYNIEWRKLSELSALESIPLRDEETLFFRVSDTVKAGIVTFRAPTFNRVHIVQIDDAMRDPARVRSLKLLMSSNRMSQGHPVFASVCYNYEQIEAFMEAHGLSNKNIRVISAEMLSAYDQDNELTAKSRLKLDYLFKEDQKLHFFSPTGKAPFEYEGNFVLQAY